MSIDPILHPIDHHHAVQICREMKLDPKARAETLVYMVMEHGLDLIPALQSIITEADQGRIQKKAQEEEDHSPLTPMRYIKQAQVGGKPYAVVTGAQGSSYLPCSDEEVKGLEYGDSVLINNKKGRVVGRDGAVPPAGEVVPVDSICGEDAGQVVIKIHEQEMMARVPWKLQQESPIQPGQKVLYDAATRFVDQVVNSHSDGDELLTDLASLDSVSREHLGAPHPILDDMMFRIRQGILYPHWARQMGARISASYLFSGPTGTGKTMHLKVLAREVTDFLEELTGERTSPLITVDANSFYSPLFGSTENKIHSFFERLKRLGAKSMKTKEGEIVQRPLIVVLEECEALLRSRGEMGGSGHLFDRPLSLILQKISSLGNDINVPVYFVATTNRPDLLDAAARRRIGIRHVVLGTLTAVQAASVLKTKLLPSMKYRGTHPPEFLKQELINQVLNYVYMGYDAVQGIAEIRFLDNNRRTLCRRHLVTGAMLEEAVSAATDECLKESAETGDLLGIDAQGVIRSLESQFHSLSGTLRAHNLPEYCPQWFADEPLRVEHVRPLANRSRRPASWAVH
jgi:hypothetical protein